MRLHMVTKSIAPSKGFRALLALVRFFTSVCANVTGQVRTVKKALRAQLALVRFFTLEHSTVKRFGTMFIVIRFFACVLSNVNCQKFKLSEGFGAQYTPVGFFSHVNWNVYKVGENFGRIHGAGTVQRRTRSVDHNRTAQYGPRFKQ
uniref:Putative homeobox transcription factor sip1 n=1 Tax=Ixodes ricinus TaxID=34613 RepID=A0A6B0UUD5_IXORI